MIVQGIIYYYMRYLTAVFLVLIVCPSICPGQDLLFSRLDKRVVPEKLVYAHNQQDFGHDADMSDIKYRFKQFK